MPVRLFLASQVVRYRMRARFERISSELFETRLHFAELHNQILHRLGVRGIGERCLELTEPGRHHRHRPCSIEHGRDDAHVGHLTDVLAEVSDGRSAIDDDLTGVRLFFSHSTNLREFSTTRRHRS